MTGTDRTVVAHIALRPYLTDGEELRWSGRPSTRKRYKPAFGIVATSLLAVVFMLFWEFSAICALIDSLEEGFIIFASLFPVVGAFGLGATSYNLWKILFGVSKIMKRTVYGITDSRVMILYPDQKNMVLQEYWFTNMPEIRLELEKDGTGNIYFASAPETNDRNHRMESLPYHIAFYHLDEPRRVYDLISQQR